MSRIISKDQLNTFIILLRSDIDRLNEMIANKDSNMFLLSELEDFIEERNRLVEMCESLGGESL